jgi:hypothetical protein
MRGNKVLLEQVGVLLLFPLFPDRSHFHEW